MTGPEQPDKIQYLVVGGGVPHFGLLRDAAVQQWQALQDALRVRWKSSELKDSRRSVADLSGCLEKLSASLLQAHRLRNHHDDVLCHAKTFKQDNADAAALRGAVACADFEALLLQGRAGLDRVAWYASLQFKNPSKSFRKLANVLADFAEKHEDAKELLQLIRQADTWFAGTFGKLDTPNSLRDLVAHHHALVEGMRSCFGINRLAKNRVLLIDCEIQPPGLQKPVAVLGTAHQSVKWLSYIILNTVALFLGVPRLPIDAYESLWHNRSVSISDFVIAQPEGPPLGPHVLRSVRSFHPDGFVFGTDNVDPSIFEYAVEL